MRRQGFVHTHGWETTQNHDLFLFVLMRSDQVVGSGSGAVAFVFGSLILIETDVDAFQISTPLIFAVTAITALFTFTLITLAIRQRHQPVVSGREQMIGDEGEAIADFVEEGSVHIHGEQWVARSERPVKKGQLVTVRDMDGLTLVVEPSEDAT